MIRYFFVVWDLHPLLHAGFAGALEEVLFTHPDVVEAAVVGQPDPYRGEVLRAFVVLRQGSNADTDTLLEFCKTNLARYKLPARIDRVQSLPKTSVNKTDKRALKLRVLGELPDAARANV